MLGTFSLFHSLLRDCIYIKSILVCIHVAVVGGILHIAHLNTVFFSNGPTVLSLSHMLLL